MCVKHSKLAYYLLSNGQQHVLWGHSEMKPLKAFLSCCFHQNRTNGIHMDFLHLPIKIDQLISLSGGRLCQNVMRFPRGVLSSHIHGNGTDDCSLWPWPLTFDHHNQNHTILPNKCNYLTKQSAHWLVAELGWDTAVCGWVDPFAFRGWQSKHVSLSLGVCQLQVHWVQSVLLESGLGSPDFKGRKDGRTEGREDRRTVFLRLEQQLTWWRHHISCSCSWVYSNYSLYILFYSQTIYDNQCWASYWKLVISYSY